MLAATTVNFSSLRSSDAKYYEPEDFMLVEKVAEEMAPKLEQRPDDQLNTAALVHKLLSG